MSRTLGAVVLNASLTLMSILVVVITVLIIEYKRVYPDPAIAGPILKAVWGTTGASVMAGVIALLALTHLQSGRGVSDLSGRNLSPADKSKLESDILTKIQDQRIYNFVDP
jgi:hypothetical protein